MTLRFFNGDFGRVLKEFQEIAERDSNIKRIPYGNWRGLVRINAHCDDVCATCANDSRLWHFVGNGCLTSVEADVPYTFVTIMQRYAAPDELIEEENDTMTNNVAASARKMPAMNIDFGPMPTDAVAMSPYGLAVRNRDGSWLTYNAVSGQTVDVTGFTFEFENMIYKMPAAVTSIAPGDMILHQKRPMFVTEVGKHIEAVDILDSEAKTIIPVTNMFGFNFVTKVVSFINLGNTQPSADQPFGNLMPMMMAQMVFNGDSEMDFGKMMMLSMMMGGNNPFATMFNFGTAAPQVGSAS